MSTQGNDSLEAKINAVGRILGNQVVTPSSLVVGTASTPLYVDSNSQVAQGNIPFATTMAGVVVSGIVSTALSALNITGASELDNVDRLMIGQLVAGAQVTTFTKTGFIRVNIVDSSGLVTDGEHYIQIGTLS